jgi:4-diphosphocytidyl-2-C-methyl-D-erythritol kinase
VDHGVSLAEHAPAKINLALHVTGRRPDGFHLIESLVVFTRHGDRVTVAAAAEDSFSASGPFGAEIPLDGGNLVVRARDALRNLAHSVKSGRKPQPVSMHLTKHLPIASGIGGGSSDAAATLTALNRLCRFGLTSEQLAEIGHDLGADVPMCLYAKPLIARGIGEQIEPVASFPALSMVLVNPGTPVPTPDVFRALASRENPGSPPIGQLAFADVCRWLAATRNDLQVPAVSLVPAIAEVIEALTFAGASFARMSGSGATCFGLFETASKAARAALEIQKRQPGWWVVATESISSQDAVHAPA